MLPGKHLQHPGFSPVNFKYCPYTKKSKLKKNGVDNQSQQAKGGRK